MRRDKIDRTGEEGYNTFGTKMIIVEYKRNDNITVEFQDEHKEKVHTQYGNFKKGNVKNPYDREVFGVGYIGVGKYKVCDNGKTTKTYTIWHGMLMRCYDPYYINKELTYMDCIVCEEWLCYQNFAKWFYENVYNCNNERLHLDKDILIKGNKVYSPETCCLVPERINMLFTKRDAIRGEYPIGITYHKNNNKLKVQCRIYENEKSKSKHLGYFPLNRPFQAFYTYKTFKENYIKQIADEYKNLIPERLYKALYKYEVEIND